MLCFCGEATHEHYYSTVHGAWESGEREADRLLRYWRRDEGAAAGGGEVAQVQAAAVDSKGQEPSSSPVTVAYATKLDALQDSEMRSDVM